VESEDEDGMKRRNVQLAFIGEGLSGNDDVTGTVEGDEAIDITVTAGELQVIVPAGTPDAEMFTSAARLAGELVLENGLRFSFEIETGAEGAQFSVTPEGTRREEPPDLSSLPSVAGGA
jgi:hypothetical protein